MAHPPASTPGGGAAVAELFMGPLDGLELAVARPLPADLRFPRSPWPAVSTSTAFAGAAEEGYRLVVDLGSRALYRYVGCRSVT
jgi:hypothetical protein